MLPADTRLTTEDLRVPASGQRPYTQEDIRRIREAILLEVKHEEDKIDNPEHSLAIAIGVVYEGVSKRWSQIWLDERTPRVMVPQFALALLQLERAGKLHWDQDAIRLTGEGRARAVAWSGSGAK